MAVPDPFFLFQFHLKQFQFFQFTSQINLAATFSVRIIYHTSNIIMQVP